MLGAGCASVTWSKLPLPWQIAGGSKPARTYRLPVYAQKYTRRVTDRMPNPQDPFSKTTAWRGNYKSENKRNAPRNKEPFDAELVVLFGLPALIIIIPWAIKDPTALAIVPVLFFIPGIRDVLLAFLRDAFNGMRRAKQFVSTDLDQDEEEQQQKEGSRGPYKSRWAMRAQQRQQQRGPPPPPPPFKVGQVYDLTNDEFQVEPSSNTNYSNTPGSTAAAATQGSSTSSTTAAAPGKPLESYWDSDDDVTPSNRTLGTASRGGGVAADQGPRNFSRATAAAGTDSPTYRRSTTSSTERSRVRPSGMVGRDLVRKSTPGRVGVDVRRGNKKGGKEVPWYLVPIVALFPFLRFWGGLM